MLIAVPSISYRSAYEIAIISPFSTKCPFVQNEGQQEQDRENRLAALRKLLPAEVLSLAGFFPIAPNISPTAESEGERIDRLRSLFWYLPPADEAADLRHIYFQHAGGLPVSLCHYASSNAALIEFIAWM